MNFQHTEDRRMLADTLNRFVSEQYGFETRDALARSDSGFSREMWVRFAELGIIGALFQEADGGFGGEGFDIAVVFESLGRGLVVEPFLGALMVGRALALAGSERAEGAHRELDRRPRGRGARARRTGLALRTDAGVDARRARLERLGADGRQGRRAAGRRGRLLPRLGAHERCRRRRRGHLALRRPARDGGCLSCAAIGKIDGGRAAELGLNEVCLPDDALLGERDAGFATLEHSIGAGVLALCAEALGAMDVAKEHTLEYLRTRKQFGVVIGSFQALQHRMADLLLEIEQARSAVINAAAALGAGRVERERALSAAKYSIGRIGDAGCGRVHPDARRHRHDVGTAARALREAPRDDRSSARRRRPPSRTLYHVGSELNTMNEPILVRRDGAVQVLVVQQPGGA